jgi:hypothetical protein
MEGGVPPSERNFTIRFNLFCPSLKLQVFLKLGFLFFFNAFLICTYFFPCFLFVALSYFLQRHNCLQIGPKRRDPLSSHRNRGGFSQGQKQLGFMLRIHYNRKEKDGEARY